jgi:hypothetical protein
MRLTFLLCIISISFISCQSRKETADSTGFESQPNEQQPATTDTILSQDFYKRPDYILADIDGDNKQDSVVIVTDAVTKKEGLKFVLGSGRIDTLGMGKEILGQGFDDISSWAGIFEKASKGEKHANNVDENGDILAASQIPEEEWIILPNDGIYLHQEEACGGGVIYMENGEYKWIQED